jgi:hypothetical protein
LEAGMTGQATSSVAIGPGAGGYFQGSSSVAIGNAAGTYGQAGLTGGSVAIGYSAGFTGQGSNAIAIGAYAGSSGQENSTIILNATGTALNGTIGQTGAFYVSPVRNQAPSDLNYNMLGYNETTKEIIQLDQPIVFKGLLESTGVLNDWKLYTVGGPLSNVQIPTLFVFSYNGSVGPTGYVGPTGHIKWAGTGLTGATGSTGHYGFSVVTTGTYELTFSNFYNASNLTNSTQYAIVGWNSETAQHIYREMVWLTPSSTFTEAMDAGLICENKALVYFGTDTAKFYYYVVSFTKPWSFPTYSPSASLTMKLLYPTNS